jgi:nitroreductase
MELFEAIKSRRSIRKFRSEPIPNHYVDELLEAGRLAPSGTNLQPTRYVIIRTEEAREKLKGCTPLPFVAQAPVVIACCVDTQVLSKMDIRMKELKEANAFVDTPLNDISEGKSYNKAKSVMDEAALKSYLNFNVAIAIDHITLRAVDLGLGTCWIMMFDREKIKNLLNVDDRYEVVALLPVGYPDQEPVQRPRLSKEEILLKEI